ncbi:alpha/beta hydrolase [Temperatibacter marinus]|uniref:Alpha/beta hydrolase n=1 Tax=Temperatibacter marinus TaxID=1456591 RepID=A0AA52EEZ9_9PROT|nr:alpha/beta hydrolase [Temperatibacter marinus]WND01600.1 alpha/beta hydrolase [Temperatibacter marinus]
MAFASIYGLKIFYQDEGPKDHSDRPTLLFIHGWCATHKSFEEQVKAFKKSHRCLVVDLPGFGKSSKPKIDFTMTIYGEVLNGFCEKLKLKKPILIGHSLGALVALEMNWQDQSISQQLILIDSAPIIMMKQIRQNMRLTLDNIRERGIEFQMKQLCDHFFLMPDTDPHYKAELLAQSKHADKHAAEAIWAHMIDYDGKRAFKSAKAPISYISGTRQQNNRKQLERYQPTMNWAQVMRGSHICHLTEAGQVNAMIASLI